MKKEGVDVLVIVGLIFLLLGLIFLLYDGDGITGAVSYGLLGDANASQCGYVNSSGLTLTSNITNESTCLIINSSDITIDCAGFLINFTQDGSFGYAINNSGSFDNVTIKNCVIEQGHGNIANTNSSHPIYFNGSENSTLFNNTILVYGSNTYGITLNGTSDWNNISSNNVTTNGDYETKGYYLENSSNNVLDNNVLLYVMDGTSPEGAPEVGNNYGIHVYLDSNYNNISDNNLKTNGDLGNEHGINVQSSSIGTIIFNNDILANGSQSMGIYLQIDSNNTNVSGNNITTVGSSSNYGLYLEDSYNCVVDNNVIDTGDTGNLNYGIYLFSETGGTSNNNITNNNITTNGTTDNYGMYISAADNNTFYKNIVVSDGVGTEDEGQDEGEGGGGGGPASISSSIQGEVVSNTTNIYALYLLNSNYSNFTENSFTSQGGVGTDYAIWSSGKSAGNFFINNNLSAGDDMELNDTSTGPNTLIYSNTFGKVKWNKTNLSTNMTFVLGENIYVKNGTIGIDDVDTSAGVNATAELEFYTLPYPTDPQLFKNGIRCDNTDACNITYNSTSGILYANVSSFSNYTAELDADLDGFGDLADTVEGNESNVTTTGVTSLNITIDGKATNAEIFTGSKEMIFYDSTTPLINFTHDFSSGEIDLSQIKITLETNSLIINMSGQLATGETKTLTLTDNSFATLCVKDAEISTVDDISSGCDGTDETDFTTCLGVSTGTTIGNLTCYDDGTTIRIENLSFSGVRGAAAAAATTATASSSGSNSGGTAWGICGDTLCNDGEKCAPDSETNNNGGFCAKDCGVCPASAGEEVIEEIVEESVKEVVEKITPEGKPTVEERKNLAGKAWDLTELIYGDYSVHFIGLFIILILGVVSYLLRTHFKK